MTNRRAMDSHIRRWMSRKALAIGTASIWLLFLAAVSCIAQTASYPLDAEGFVRDWLIAGPYPNPQREPEPIGWAGDPLKHLGGEANVEPYEGMKDTAVFVADKARLIAGIGSTNEWGFTETKTFPVVWTALHWDKEDPVISLDRRYPVNDWIVTYAVCWIESTDDRGVQIRLGSDDGYKLWLNHEYLGGLTLSRGAAKDQNIHQAHLRKGLNLLLLKIEDRTGGHGFCLRITDSHGEPTLSDLRVVIDDPRRKLAAGCSNIGQVDVTDGSGFARIRLGDGPLFPGKAPLSVMLGLTEPRHAEVSVRVTDASDRELFSRTLAADLKPDQALPVEAELALSTPGAVKVGVLVKDAGSQQVLANLTRSFEVLDPQALARQREELQRLLAERNQRKSELSATVSAQAERITALRKQAAGQYEAIERLYAANRASLAQRYGKRAYSIDEAPTPVSNPRESICLNGDGWELAAATTVEGYYKVDETQPPASGWEPSWAPLMGIEKYFRYYYFPVTGKGDDYGPTENNKSAPKGWRLSDSRIGGGMWLRTAIDVPQRWSGQRVLIETESAWWRMKVFLDGKYCGEHKGMPGRVSIELPGAAPGKHELLVFVQRGDSVGEPKVLQDEYWGLLGDIWLTSLSDVAVSDTWVITSWRDAAIQARVWVTNSSDSPRTVSVNCQAMREGRVRLNIGAREVTLAPGETRELRFTHSWVDAQTWGIGGEWGPPNLYNLVTTVTEGLRALDRHFTRFGFREFWKEGLHFYLNGKRVFIQGDNIGGRVSSRPEQVIWQHLLRDTGNINTIRCHYEHQQTMYASIGDELGMFIIPQWYAVLDKPGVENPTSIEDFLQTDIHRENLRLYDNWVKSLRNHPSVVIYSTDNEIFTQSWDTPDKLDVNIRNDKLGAIYGQYVKGLDPTRLVTRDGDEGTWGKIGKWEEDPPAEIANYHYPDFDTRDLVENWESTYEKPALFGETLYCAYGAWDGWIGAIPTQVSGKALRVRKVIGMYRDLGIPGWVGMGLGLDGFTELKEDGSGNPWGISPSLEAEYKANGQLASLPLYPYFPIEWPSLSGPSLKPEFHRFLSVYGYGSVNAYDPNRPVAVLNAVNRAYKESSRPMAPLPTRRPTEALVTVTQSGKPMPFAWVWLVPKAGQATERLGVRADSKGRAWFALEEPGAYEVQVEGVKGSWPLRIRDVKFRLAAGFGYLPRYAVEVSK